MEEEANSGGKVTTTTARNEWKTAAFGNTLDHVPVRFLSTLQKQFSLQWSQHLERYLSIFKHFYRNVHGSREHARNPYHSWFCGKLCAEWEQIKVSCNSSLNFLYWGFSSNLNSRWITGQKCKFSLSAFPVAIFLFGRIFYKNWLIWRTPILLGLSNQDQTRCWSV